MPTQQQQGLTPGQAATITAGAQVASTGINAMAQSNLNRKTQKWNEKIMAQQRQQSLADWTMQNEYNSPQAQMARLKAAGLNPNLIYGKIDTSSPVVRSTDAKTWNPTAPRIDLNAGQVMQSYFDTKMKVAQTNNIEAQNTNIALDALYKFALINKTNTETETNKFNLRFKEDTRNYSLQALEQGLRKSGIDIGMGEAKLQYQLTENETQKAIQQSTIKGAALAVLQQRLQNAKTIAETDQIRENINVLKQNQRLNAFEETLNKIGLTKNDPRWMRVVNEIVTDPNITKSVKGVYDKYVNTGNIGNIIKMFSGGFNK